MLPPEILEYEKSYLPSPQVPSAAQIKDATRQLFAASWNCDNPAVWHSLFPTDPYQEDRQEGYKTVTNVPLGEYGQLRKFVRQLQDVLATCKDLEGTIRLMLAIYCHILEADFPVAVVWNLLRTVNGDETQWVFIDANKKCCRYPTQKIAEILRLSQGADMQIGRVLSALWDAEIRNAFSHSQYVFGSGCIMSTATWSPISRHKRTDSWPGGTPVRLSYIEALYEGAVQFLRSFTDEYFAACSSFSFRPWPHDDKRGGIYAVLPDTPKHLFERRRR